MLFATLSLTGCSGAPKLGWAGTLVSGDTLYVGTIEGKINAYDLANERAPLWSLAVGESAVLYGQPAVAGGYVYIANAAGEDFTLTAGSSCKTSGVAGVGVATDYSGYSYTTTTPSSGAYQFR